MRGDMKRQKSQRSRGRPPLPSGQAKRFTVAFRVTANRYRELFDAAEKSGRSVSQEAEMRLEQTFRDEEYLGGAETGGVLQMMSGACRVIEARLNGKWSSSMEIYHEVRKAWRKIIDDVKPKSTGVSEAV